MDEIEGQREQSSRKAKRMSVLDPKRTIRPSTESAFSAECQDKCTSFLLYFFLFMAVSIAIGLFLGPLGILIIVMAPGWVIIHHAFIWFRHYVTRCTIWDVLLTCAFWTFPLTIAIFFIDQKIPMKSDCTGTLSSADVGTYFFQVRDATSWLRLLGTFSGQKHCYKPSLRCSLTAAARRVLLHTKLNKI